MKPGGALMLLLKGKPKDGVDEQDESGKDDESSPEEYEGLLKTAFDESADWSDRAAALREFVHSCMDEG